MAKGSDPALKWKNWNGSRECSYCGKKLTLELVGEYRHHYDDRGRISETFIWCVDHRGGRG